MARTDTMFAGFGRLGLAMAALVLSAAGADAQGTFSCSTVVAQGQYEPGSTDFQFSKSFGDDAVVNAAGDVVFSASPRAALTKRNQAIYLFPNGGTGEVVVRQGDPAPGGGTFSSVARNCFSAPCLTDDGDLAFAAHLLVGEGLFARQSGSGLQTVVRSGDASPAGGFFEAFPRLAGCTSSADMVFVGTVEGGADGLFVWDAGADAVSPLYVVGDSAGGGRLLCEFGAASASDGGVAFRALTKTDCAAAETPVEGVFVSTGGTLTTIALEGDATPVAGGTTYRAFLKDDVPQVNAAGEVSFGAQTTGTVAVQAIFHYVPTPLPITAVTARQFDPAPGTGGGILRRFYSQRLADTGATFVKASFRATPAKQGVLLYDGTPEAALLKSDPVPTDAFGPGATYRGLKGSGMGISRDGAWLAITALVKDTVRPKRKRAVLRCQR